MLRYAVKKKVVKLHTVLSGANVVAVVVVVAGVVDMRCKQVSSAIQIVYDNKYKTDSL